MAEHPVVGERILLRTQDLAAIAPIVRHEHEHWDGTGYPDGLRERHGSRSARAIILACDAYVAMITARPYRAALHRDEAVAELRAGAGHAVRPRRRRRAARPARARPPRRAGPRAGRQARRAAPPRSRSAAGARSSASSAASGA